MNSRIVHNLTPPGAGRNSASTLLSGLLLLTVSIFPVQLSAQGIPEAGPTSVAVLALSRGAPLLELSDGGTVAPGDAAEFEVLLEPATAGWSSFDYGAPTSPTGAFASARMTSAGDGAVGVSGFFEEAVSLQTLAASVTYAGEIRNIGFEDLDLELTYEIPAVELYVTLPTEFATAQAQMTADYFDAGGNHLSRFTLFDYTLSYDVRGGFDPQDRLAASADLLAHSAGLLSIDDPDCGGFCAGVHVASFSRTVRAAILAPGERLAFSYLMFADLGLSPEDGGHALVGDPFAFSGGGSGIEFRVAASPVPLPGALCLMSGSLLVLGSAMHSRSRARRAHARIIR